MSSVDAAETSLHTNRLSLWFERVAIVSYDKARYLLGLYVLFMAFTVFMLGQLTMDLSPEGRLHKTDTLRVQFDQFRQQFGRDDVILISVPVGDTLTLDTLKTVQHLQQQIETQVPYVKEVNSVINARMTYGDQGELIIEELLEGELAQRFQQRWPEQSLKEYLLNDPNYRGRLISVDGKTLAIAVELQHSVATLNEDNTANVQAITQEQVAEAVNALRQQIQAMPEANTLHMAGSAVIDETLSRQVFNDTNLTGGMAFVLMFMLLWFFFRRLSGVLIPLLVVNSSLLCAVGFMALNGAPWTLTFGTMPPVLLAIGIADAVHILSIFYKQYQSPDSKRAAIIYAVRHSAPAVLLTSLTTAAGFLSFVVADLASIADLGFYTAIAVGFALLYSVVLIPALLAVLPVKAMVTESRALVGIDRFTQACVYFSCRYKKSVTVIAVLVLVLGTLNALRLSFSDNVLEVFPDREIAKQDFYAMDKAFSGISNLEVIVDSGHSNGIKSPAFLLRLQQISDDFSNQTLLGVRLADSYSVLNILKETHKALNNNEAAFYRIADEQDLIAQELLLFELSERDDLLKVIDADYRYARLTLKMHYEDGVVYQAFMQALQAKLDQTFGDGNAYITGATAVSSYSIPRALRSMTKSYAIAIVVITILMGVMIRSVRIGLISMLPNLLPIVLVLNVMLLLGWSLDQTTISIGAIALGLVVDDTLHFLYHFKQYFQRFKQAERAAIASVKSCGPALFMTSVTFGFGSLTNMASSLNPFIIFGISLWLVAVLALLADLLVAPAVLSWVYSRESEPSEATDLSSLLQPESQKS